MKMSVYRILAIACILSICFTTVLLFSPMSDADPTEYRYETHEYWIRCVNIPGEHSLSFTEVEHYVSGRHEGDHWSGSCDSEGCYVPPVPHHETITTYVTVYHLSWIRCAAA